MGWGLPSRSVGERDGDGGCEVTKAWVDTALCSGCGACLSACPADAIALVAGRARVDTERCQGCLACIKACPVQAIREVFEVALPEAPEATAPIVRRQPTPVAQSLAVAAAVTSAGLMLRVVRSLASGLGHWVLSREVPPSSAPARRSGFPQELSHSNIQRLGRGGHRARQRHRGQG